MVKQGESTVSNNVKVKMNLSLFTPETYAGLNINFCLLFPQQEEVVNRHIHATADLYLGKEPSV